MKIVSIDLLLALLTGLACGIAQAEELSYSGYREDTNQACQTINATEH
jgi:hypothetical protein